MAKQHATTLRSKAYLMGKLTNVIWGDDWDVEYFVDNWTKMSFGKLIHDTYGPNPKAQRSIQHVVHTLMGLPYNWTTPKKCYWRAIRQFVIFRYGIWCNLHDLSKMTCFGLANFIKPNFVSESCCHV
jgi:hypothetical protein